MSEATTAGGKGGKADQIAAEARVAAFGWRVSGVASGVAGVAALAFLPGVPGPVMALAGVVAAPLLWRRAPAAAEPAGRANRGNDAEAEILAAIQTVPGVAWVEQGRQLAGSRARKEDTDFIVAMNTGALAVIEAKSAFGRMTVTNGVLFTASRAIHHGSHSEPGGSPMAQASRGAGYVREALQADGVPAGWPSAVVCAHRGLLRAPLRADDGPCPATVVNVDLLPALLTALAGQGATVAPADVARARKAVRRAHHRR